MLVLFGGLGVRRTEEFQVADDASEDFPDRSGRLVGEAGEEVEERGGRNIGRLREEHTVNEEAEFLLESEFIETVKLVLELVVGQGEEIVTRHVVLHLGERPASIVGLAVDKKTVLGGFWRGGFGGVFAGELRGRGGDSGVAGLGDPGMHEVFNREVGVRLEGVPEVVADGILILITVEIIADALHEGGVAHEAVEHKH